MFANLLGQKAIHRLRNEDMAKIAGISRTAYESKLRTGHFTVLEAHRYAEYFDKKFEYLFALDNDPPEDNR